MTAVKHAAGSTERVACLAGDGQNGAMKDGPPDDDAYERVTNPERFRRLHEAADALVARLEAKFQLDRIDDGAPVYEGVIRQVQLVPVVGAPLVFCWTDFPGVRVRFGRWHDEAYPNCGCDACDEDAEELVEDLENEVEGAVAGQFTESVMSDAEGIWLTFEFAYSGGRKSGKQRLSEGDTRRNQPGPINWPGWPLREADE